MSSYDLGPFFPFAKIRVEQVQAIEFILDAFLVEKKRFVVCQLAPGTGKSAIGVTVARYLEKHAGKTSKNDVVSGTYVLTTQKVLQQQYVDDFGGSSGKNLVKSLKSASNYQCKFYSDQTCAGSRRLLKQLGKQLEGTAFQKCCRGSCYYANEKQEFMEFPISVTNFAYFFAETMYARQLEPRALLVIDEAHNVENALGAVIEVTFSEKFARQLGCKVPKLNSAEAVVKWIMGPYKKAAMTSLKELEKKLSVQLDGNDDVLNPGLGDMSKRYELLDKHVCKVNRFINEYDPNNWVMNVVRSSEEKRGSRKFEFKPVDVSPYGEENLFSFGSRVLLMSATIVDNETFCRAAGIDMEQTAFLNIGSPFPVENRPVHYLGVGSMSMRCIDETLPKMVQVVRELLELHSDVKGMIHCVNFRIAKAIVDAIKSPRLLLHDSSNRESVIEFHKKNPDPTVLVSPSMMEGIDLADDASRFQILCKVPFPYLGDQVVQLRKEKTKNWYACQTARSVIQALGRSVRNDKDHAVSYILDADWVKFYTTNHSMFPSEFSAALS